MAMHPRKSLVAVLLTGMLLLSVVALSSCQNVTSGSSKYSDAIKAARTGIWEDVNSGKASSGSVAILDGGAIVYSEAFGMVDRATSTPVTANTLFNSGSIGKAYCTSAVMKLVDSGKVKLDSPVTQYLPEFKMEDPRYKDITVRMLLDHQSGLPGTTAANDFGYKVNPDFYSQVYANLTHSHLKAAPGYSAPYCNDGFSLAEMLVAKVSGQKYIDYLTNQILNPLSLSRTGVSIGVRPDAGVASFYQPETGKKVPPEAVTLLGAGGLSTTAEELVRFGDSFTKGGKHVLSQKSIDEMTTTQQSTWAKETIKQVGFNPELAYGLGLDAVSIPGFQKQGIKVIAKGGDTQDFHSELLVVPDKRIAVAVMEVGHGSTASKIALGMLKDVLVAKGLMKKEPTTVTGPKAPQPLPAGYEVFAGLYDNGSEVATVAVDTKNNTVSVTKPGGEPYTLIYNSGSLYDPKGTRLALILVDGQTALLGSINGLWMTSAQKIPTATGPKSLQTDIDGSQWLRRNAKPWESIDQTSGYVVTSTTEPGLPGYVVMGGSKLVESPTFAGMTSSVIRDLSELNLLDRNGQTWVQLSDMLFSPPGVASTLDLGQKSITIGKDGYNEWLKAGQDLVLDVKKPGADRVVVFGPDGTSIYDSVVDSGKVFVPAGDLIELAGSSGDAFTVTATSAAGG
jgi:CubicO group peptidase (beta-lactamase class C family)